MKKSQKFSALFVACLLLLQPTGFYIHALDHNYWETTTGKQLDVKKDGFCGHCFNFLNQSGEIFWPDLIIITNEEVGSYQLLDLESTISFYKYPYLRGPPTC